LGERDWFLVYRRAAIVCMCCNNRSAEAIFVWGGAQLTQRRRLRAKTG
jgi:hypothetical protein